MSENTGVAAAAQAVSVLTGQEAPAEAGIDQINAQNLDPKLGQQQENLQDAVEEAIADGATPAEVKKMIKEYEIKVNGKKKKVAIDLSDEKEIVRRLQLSEASHSAMQESAELKKLFNQEILKAKQNPWAFLSELGLDADQLMEQRLIEKVEEAKKSPEQLEREKLQKELSDARAELEKQKKDAEESKFAQLQQQAHAELESELLEALDKNPQLPKTKKTIRRIADAMEWAMNNGFEQVSVHDVIPAVEAEIRAEFNEFISELPEDVMESYIGQKGLDKLRKKRIAQSKVVPSVEAVKAVTKPVVVEKKEERKSAPINSKDFFRNIGKK